MYHRNFAGLVMGVPQFLFQVGKFGAKVVMPGHMLGGGERSVARPKIHGFSGAKLREMRRVNGIGSSHRRKRAQAALARAAKRAKAVPKVIAITELPAHLQAAIKPKAKPRTAKRATA